ncbi:hypothetical protein J2X68_007175 [Streptomyces sp. 3330]|nr:hypothetical protein [Streptomyces sp. 3330]
MANTTESTGGSGSAGGRGNSRRRVKVLLWRAALGAAYTGGGLGLTLVVRWLLGL